MSVYIGSGSVKQGMQSSAVLLGNSLQFSNSLLRVLDFEFPEVRFDRKLDTDSLLKIMPRPAVVVIHESLPDLAQSVRDVRTQLPATMIAVAGSDASAIRGALSSATARSISLLPLNTPIDVWLSILRLLLCGYSYAPAEEFCGSGESVSPQPEGPAESANGAAICLTPRELQILPLIAQGLQNKVISATLGLSEHTVKLHTRNIFAKLGVSNRTAAANWYLSEVEGAAHSEESHAN